MIKYIESVEPIDKENYIHSTNLLGSCCNCDMNKSQTRQGLKWLWCDYYNLHNEVQNIILIDKKNNNFKSVNIGLQKLAGQQRL